MCKEALGSPKYQVNLKYCYETLEEMAVFATPEFYDHNSFDSIYHASLELGWRSTFYSYEKEACVEGSFFPFVRMNKFGKKLIDTGCIWLGARNCYPRLFVDNGFCRWYYPMDSAGNILTIPFLPYLEAKKHADYLVNDNIVGMLEGRALE